jgi:hypothetical protein
MRDRFREFFDGKLVHYVINDDYSRKCVRSRGFVCPGDERFEFGSSYVHLFGNWYLRRKQ